MPFLPSQLMSSLKTKIMPSHAVCPLANEGPEHFQKSSLWLCSKCQCSHSCTQDPSVLSKGIGALRCNLRTTSRINKSLPWWQILPFTSSPIKPNFSNPISQCSLMGSLFCLFHLVQARSKQEKMHKEPPSILHGKDSGTLCFLQCCLIGSVQTFVI